MDRYWLLTWTTYGTWLPGDKRGFVSPVRQERGKIGIHNIPGTPYDADDPSYERYARSMLKCPPVHLNGDQAKVLLDQFHETARYQSWKLLAIAIMYNHVHLVVGVPGDPDPADLLRDFKSYGSRALNRKWSKPLSETWWTESGSRRKLQTDANVLAAIQYVNEQPNPLIFWADEQIGRIVASGEQEA